MKRCVWVLKIGAVYVTDQFRFTVSRDGAARFSSRDAACNYRDRHDLYTAKVVRVRGSRTAGPFSTKGNVTAVSMDGNVVLYLSSAGVAAGVDAEWVASALNDAWGRKPGGPRCLG